LEKLKTANFKREALFIQEDLPASLPKTFEKDTLASIVLSEISPNLVRYRAQSEKEQFAVFSEMYYPNGWTAKINGEETPIYNVNYVLRAVQLPAGENQIEFSFNPSVVKQGTNLRWLSALLFLGIVSGMGYLEYRTKKYT